MRRVLLLVSALVFAGSLDAAILNLRTAPYSAVGDGTTDDRAALAAAFSAAKMGDTILVPVGDYRIVLGNGRLVMPDGVTLLGESGRSRFLLVSENGKREHREFLQPGSSCVFQGVSFLREENFAAVFFPLFGDREGITFRDCIFEGGVERFPGTYCHAFQVGNGALKNLTLEKIELRGFTFGLFQANQATGSVEGVVVRQSLFERNQASDLEFNAPNGRIDPAPILRTLFDESFAG
jgi:hypothetical protein